MGIARDTARQPVKTEMVLPTESFTGFPDGKTPVRFEKDIPIEVPETYAYTLRQKGLINQRPLRKDPGETPAE